MKPLLTIIMPNDKHGAHLKTSVDAICNQAFKDFELIIFGDFSDEKSLTTQMSLAWNNLKIRLFDTKKKEGIAKSLNFGMTQARGEYCFFLSPSDWILPPFFETSIDLLLKHPKAPLCVSDHGFFYENEEIVHTKKVIPHIKEASFFDDKEIVENFKRAALPIPEHTAIMKKSAILECGGVNPSLGFLSNWFLMHSIALKGGVAYLPKTLSAERMVPTDLKRKKETYGNLIKHLGKEKELRQKFAESTLLRPMIQALLPKMLFKPFDWDLILPLLQNRFSKRP